MEQDWVNNDIDRFNPYFFDWCFTPIEYAVWQNIRSCNIPLFPQFPVKKYFIDFANPFKKIAIECDGKMFHDQAKDFERDQCLKQEGWTIYRIPGHVCNRVRPAPWEIEEQDEKKVAEWFLTTSHGLMYCVGVAHFDKTSSKKWNEVYPNYFEQTLALYKS